MTNRNQNISPQNVKIACADANQMPGGSLPNTGLRKDRGLSTFPLRPLPEHSWRWAEALPATASPECTLPHFPASEAGDGVSSVLPLPSEVSFVVETLCKAGPEPQRGCAGRAVNSPTSSVGLLLSQESLSYKLMAVGKMVLLPYILATQVGLSEMFHLSRACQRDPGKTGRRHLRATPTCLRDFARATTLLAMSSLPMRLLPNSRS